VVTTTARTPAAVGVLDSLRATPTAARYLLGGVLLNQIGAFVQLFLVLYLVHRGHSVERAGLCLGIYSLGAVVGTLLGGELTHRAGARATIAVSMAASGLLVGVMPWLSSTGRYPLLLPFAALAGAATMAYRPAAAAMLSDLIPERHRVMAFSMMRIALNLGTTISPLVAAGVILIAWDLLFWIDGVTALGYSALAVALLPPDRERYAARSSPPVAGGVSGQHPYASLVRDTRFLAYLAAMLLSSAVYVQFTAVVPLKLAVAGHPTVVYSGVLVLASVILVATELKVTAYVARWPTSLVAGLGTVVFSLGLAGYGMLSRSVGTLVICTVVFVTGVMLSGPTMFAHPATAPAALRGRYLGASQATFGLGSALGPAVGVLAWARIGDTVWLACAAIGVLSAACAVWGVHEKCGSRSGLPEPAKR
jgi:MFS family permease